jgi:hypothetical protein
MVMDILINITKYVSFFQNRVPRRRFGSKKENVTSERKSCVICSPGLRQVHPLGEWDFRAKLVENLREKKLLLKHGCRWEDSTLMDLEELWYEDMIQLVQGTVWPFRMRR